MVIGGRSEALEPLDEIEHEPDRDPVAVRDLVACPPEEGGEPASLGLIENSPYPSARAPLGLPDLPWPLPLRDFSSACAPPRPRENPRFAGPPPILADVKPRPAFHLSAHGLPFSC